MERINMNKAIQFSALVLATSFLLVGCGKGGGVPAVPEPSEPSVVQNGLEGTVVKGIVAGAGVTVVDANGEQLDVFGVETGADGSYTITFSTDTIAAGIQTPIQVIIDGTGATAVCDVVNSDGSGDDCLNADGTTYAAFGETFTLPSGFQLRAVIPTLPDPTAVIARATVNPNPFTELATAIALGDGATLTETAVNEANAEVLGILQLLFPGIDVSADMSAGGYNLNSIPIVDITDLENAGTVPALSHAMAALSASFAALVDPDVAAFANLGQVISTLRTAFKSGVTNGILALIGEQSAAVFASIVADLTEIDPTNTSLDALGDISDGASAVAGAYGGLPPDDTVDIPVIDIDCGDDCPEPPVCSVLDAACALSLTQSFVAGLSDMIVNLIALVGLNEDGTVPVDSSLIVFHDQFMFIADTYSADSMAAFDNLMDGIDAAAREIKLGTSASITVTGTNLSYTVAGTESATGSDFTVTDAKSVSGGVTLEIASGTKTVVEASGVETTGSFSATDISMVTASSAGTLQTFTGSVSATFTAETAGLGLTSLDMDGNVNVAGTDGGDWGVELDLTGLTGVSDGDTVVGSAAGSYSATFSVDDLSFTLEGERAAGVGTLDDFSISLDDQVFSGSVTRVVAASGAITDTTTLTDGGEVTLTLTTLLPVSGATSTTGVFTALGFETGDLDNAGLITYSDETVQQLAATIFAGAAK